MDSVDRQKVLRRATLVGAGVFLVALFLIEVFFGGIDIPLVVFAGGIAVASGVIYDCNVCW